VDLSHSDDGINIVGERYHEFHLYFYQLPTDYPLPCPEDLHAVYLTLILVGSNLFSLTVLALAIAANRCR
jgi:hypothetical protein